MAVEFTFWIVAGVVVVWWIRHRAEKTRQQATEDQCAREKAALQKATASPDPWGLTRPSRGTEAESSPPRPEPEAKTPPRLVPPPLILPKAPSAGLMASIAEQDARGGLWRTRTQPPSGRAPESSEAPAKISPPRWIPSDEPISLGGVTIPGGMIYVGKDENRHKSWRDLIDPSLTVTPCHSLSRAPSLTYWPSYAYLEPEARGAYLRWLAEGRQAADVDIGYVFLFFYGLERRLFADKAVDEAPVLIAEVERLYEIYAGNHSFRRYSRSYLDAARVLVGRMEGPPSPDASPEWTGEVPMAVRYGIGTILAQDKPLTADWMLAWYLGHEETRLRTSAQRCFQEFRTLFRLRFNRAYPNGLTVKAPKGKLKLDFHPSSGDFHAALTPPDPGVPDISRLKAPVRKVTEIAESCMADLDSYSRLLGREPEAVNSLKALALLPEDLRGEIESTEVDAFRKWLDDVAGSQPSAIMVDNLLTRLNLAQAPLDKVGKPLARSLAQTLRLLGYGMDPDVDLGGNAPRPGEPVAVYRLPAEPPPEGAFGDAYGSAAAVVALTALVIHADDQVTRDEEEHLVRLIEDNLHLCEHERAHLQAHALRLLAAPPSLAQMRTRLKQTSKTEREHLARFALAVAAADGHVAAAEIKLLENIYKHLDLDPDQLYGDIHALGGQRTDEPVVVRPADVGPADHIIPSPPAQKPEAQSGVTLNMRHVEKVRGDTHEVSALLSDIFSAEEPEPEAEAEAEVDPSGAANFNGLDRRHASLLTCLLDRDDWPREDFNRLCRDFDLLPDGATEVLNEWAFDAFDDPILEGDDPITLNRNLLSP